MEGLKTRGNQDVLIFDAENKVLETLGKWEYSEWYGKRSHLTETVI